MLTYIQINTAKPRAKAWSLSDSQGLHLAIQPNGSKLWRFKYRFLDKQKTLHLGGWPTISLADARIRRDEAKKPIAVGIDPALEKKWARIAAKYAAIAQMLITITIQLNLGAVIEGLSRHLGRPGAFRSLLQGAVERQLDQLAGEGIAIGSLRAALLEARYFPIKYLLRAATLETREAIGAADVNKAYGNTAPNFLLGETER